LLIPVVYDWSNNTIKSPPNKRNLPKPHRATNGCNKKNIFLKIGSYRSKKKKIMLYVIVFALCASHDKSPYAESIT